MSIPIQQPKYTTPEDSPETAASVAESMKHMRRIISDRVDRRKCDLDKNH